MVNDLIDYNIAPAFFKGCHRSPRKCIQKHAIPESEYIFACKRNNSWKVYNRLYRASKLFLSSHYVEKVAIHYKPKDNRISSEQVQNVFDKCVGTFPCVYLFSLTEAKNNEFVDSDNENAMIYKFGLTTSIKLRTNQHDKSYGAMDHVNMALECFTYIDPSYLKEAETKLRTYFKMADMLISHKKYKELVLIPNDKLPLVKSMYSDISNLYSYKNNELIYRMKELEYLLEKKNDNSTNNDYDDNKNAY